ncbi:hypothetical protein OG225_41005 (plasmid) [Nocardia sp. NBC_01377]|uniref:hypothetical protein n=1 Tax=Nocardia sp. NBC_01377 TaxID=2903595 RepID=UPI002F90CA29
MDEPTGRYFARSERALRASGTTAADGRLSAAIDIELTDHNGVGARQIPSPYQVMGPGDVARLAPGAVVRRFPAPGCSDAETSKLAFVELAAIDLPWRYTPQLPDGMKLAPWMVLLVGVPGGHGLSLRPDGTVQISVAVQNDHKLTESALWAHVHQVGVFERARLLSPAKLAVQTQYSAALVPAFTVDGNPCWSDTPTEPVVLPCYDHWEFRTGPEGDFKELARQLRRADLAELALRGGRPFGRADLAYIPRTGAPPSILPAGGALRVPSRSTPDPADAPPPALVASDVAALQTSIAVPDGRDVITSPDYPGAFTAAGTVAAPAGWITQLTDDPRLRGAAGLGAWNAAAWQQQIADAAATKLGDTVMAAEQIRSLALGVAASRSMWRRRVPVDTAAALLVLAPSLARLPTGSGDTVLDAISGRTPQLSPALFSSAARRATRPGPARSAQAAEGAADLGAMIGHAARCPDPSVLPDPFERLEPDPGADRRAAARKAIFDSTDDVALATAAAERLLSGADVNVSWLAATLDALRPGPDGRTDPEAVDRVLTGDGIPDLEDPTSTWPEVPDEHAPECRPVDIQGLGLAVAKAIDPTVPVPPVARRVFAMLPGVTSMGPLEVEPELDLPLWSFLSTASPDWMLPGVGDLAEHEVVGVETNPTFVRALLVGANWQVASELRWRNVPLVPRSSPLRRFWQREPGTPPKGSPNDVYDIRPVRFWEPDVALGDGKLSPTNRGSEAVVVFNTPLFRRYPTTVVYLYDARPTDVSPPDWAPPDPNLPLQATKRVEPTFTGTIGTDVTFFGFPVPASALSNHWVVLEEPPAGYRFYAEPQPDVPVPAEKEHSGDYAHRRFALPVRVLLGPLL